MDGILVGLFFKFDSFSTMGGSLVYDLGHSF